MTTIVMLLALIGTAIQFGFSLPAVYSDDCPQPGDMIPVTIDIKPGSYPNPVNLKSEGLIPVALLGSTTLNVANVDLGTIGFHPMGRCEQAIEPARYRFTDVNGDDYTDIIFHFEAQEVGFQPEDTGACLHGILKSGEHFCGHDSVVIIGY